MYYIFFTILKYTTLLIEEPSGKTSLATSKVSSITILGNINEYSCENCKNLSAGKWLLICLVNSVIAISQQRLFWNKQSTCCLVNGTLIEQGSFTKYLRDSI